MRSRERFLRLGLVVMLAGAVFLLLGIRSSPPVRAAVVQLKIMPLGDSITSGSASMASYRCELQKLTGVSNFNYVGSVHGQLGFGTPPPPPNYCPMGDWDNEGHSGFRIDDILAGAGSWPGNLLSWATAAHPDIVLVHLGTVDLVQNESVESTVAGISQVIDTLRAVNPHVKIVLAQIIPCRPTGVNGPDLATVPQFNALLPGLVDNKADRNSPILLVNMYTNFDPALYTVDGTHPNSSGEAKMALRWKNTIDQIVPIQNYWTFVPAVIR